MEVRSKAIEISASVCGRRHARCARTTALALTGAETSAWRPAGRSSPLIAGACPGEPAAASGRPVGRLALSLAMTAARPTALIGTAITLEIGAAAVRLADGEISRLPLFLVPFDPRQGGANQRSMHRTVFDDVRRVSHLVFRLTEPLDLLDLFNAVGVLAIVGVRCAAIAGGLDGFLNVLMNAGRAHGRGCRRRSRQDGSRVAAFGDAGEDFLVERPGGVFLSATGRLRRLCRRARRRRSCSESA